MAFLTNRTFHQKARSRGNSAQNPGEQSRAIFRPRAVSYQLQPGEDFIEARRLADPADHPVERGVLFHFGQRAHLQAVRAPGRRRQGGALLDGGVAQLPHHRLGGQRERAVADAPVGVGRLRQTEW